MTEPAELIMREYTGRLPEHSLFMGCSSGWHQALAEVQRFPADYDGVVRAIPAIPVFTWTPENTGRRISVGVRCYAQTATRFLQAPSFH
ncbi:MAG: tannase/feruloyl esterase family alpha/beta hydrolase [Acidobacteria bacterium]|nr:tannase/feruloyl esterase family alpha/beta hydrolase [Acidobacteriota bacterium]